MADPTSSIQQLARRTAPLWGLAALLAGWSIAVALSSTTIIPGPLAVALGIVELARKGLLVRYVVASLFRVTWGYLSAVLLGVPFGLTLGWFRRGERAVGPLLQVLRPISPIAWTPIAILWCGVGDLAAIFIIFIASFLPIAFATMTAVRNVSAVQINAGRNFGIEGGALIRRVLFPAILPQVIVALRITLGIAWLVVVAAEMLAVNSGLGFLIVEARNAGDRYDLVVAGMVLIGLIGLGLDAGMRRLERLPSVRWSYAAPAAGGAS